MSKFLKGYVPRQSRDDSKGGDIEPSKPAFTRAKPAPVFRADIKKPDTAAGSEPVRKRGRYRCAEDRPDTSAALKALLLKMGGGHLHLRASARTLGTGHSALSGYLNGKRPPPTLDTMAAFTECAANNTGVQMRLIVLPDRRVEWDFM